MDWMQIKEIAVASTGISKDALHVIAGFALVMITVFSTRVSLASPVPLLVVSVAVICNEIYDANRAAPWTILANENRGGVEQDVWLTLLIPGILFVVARYWPNRLIGDARQLSSAPSEAG